MTCINITITAAEAWVSSDTFVSDLSGVTMPLPGATTDLEAAARSALTGRGHARPATLLAHVGKIFVNAERRVVVSGTGQFEPILRWAKVIEETDDTFDRLAGLAPEMLRSRHQGEACMIVMAGWSEDRERALAFAFFSTGNFEPVDLSHAHSISPMPALDDPHYGELAELWEAAALGHEVPAFHLALCRAQARTCRRGLYAAGIGIGGTCHLATVDRAVASVRILGGLDEG